VQTKLLSILTYHSIDTSGSVISTEPGTFADQMSCLVDGGFRGISLKEALDHRQQFGDWPSQSVVLTFDDGFANFYDNAHPVLERYRFSATVFLVTGHMGGRNNWELPPQGLGTLPILSWHQAEELSKVGIELGSHTRTHRDLRRCSSQEAKLEISGSRADIEAHLGVKPESMAYPYGGVNHLVQHLVTKDFRAACTTELRRTLSDPLNLLPRIDTYYLKSLRRMVSLLDGRLDPYLTVRRCGRLARRMFVSAAAMERPAVELASPGIGTR